jgi:hypothetical protein
MWQLAFNVVVPPAMLFPHTLLHVLQVVEDELAHLFVQLLDAPSPHWAAVHASAIVKHASTCALTGLQE